MAFNAFTEVVLDEAKNMLIAKGRSNPSQGAGTKMFAAVVGIVGSDCRRTAAYQVTDPSAEIWTAEIPNEIEKIDGCDDIHPFSHEDVYVLGFVDSPEHGRELWVNVLSIGGKTG